MSGNGGQSSSAIMANAAGSMHQGNASEAASLYREAAAAAREEGSVAAERDAVMGEAEAVWQAGDKALSLQCYDRALILAKGDDEAEGMICIGKGFALLNMGENSAALEPLRRASELCGEGGGPQATFVENLIAQAKLSIPEGGGGGGGGGGRRGDEATEDGELTSVLDAEAASEAAAKRAYAAGAIEKSPLVLVIKGTPSAPQCGFSQLVVRALDKERAVYSHIDVNGDAVLSSAFKTIADWPTVPMLFVRGRLFGGSDVVSEYLREEGGLRRALEEELTARGVIGEELEAVFSAEEVIGGGCDGGKDGQHAEGYSPAHRQMLLRLVTRVAAEVKGANKGPEPSDGLAPFLGQDSGNGQSEVLAKFVSSLSEALGGFQLPGDLLGTHATPLDVVEYVVENCPAQGDCNKCPTKEKCKAHGEGGDGDIEDLEEALCGTSLVSKALEGEGKGGKGRGVADNKGVISLSLEA